MGAEMKKTDIQSERGQTMTEFALILPLLVVLLFGIIQFGIIFNNYVTLTDAVRAGAREAAVSRGSGNPSGACVTRVLGAAGNLDQTQLQPTISCVSTWAPGSDVTVSASYPYDVSLLGWVVASGQLNSTMKERVE
jgi:Flp pilus assembly protein TadG